MWDCHTFQAYLKGIGKYELWSERIYPGMQRAIIGTMLACQDNMDRRPNTFGNDTKFFFVGGGRKSCKAFYSIFRNKENFLHKFQFFVKWGTKIF